MAPYLYVLHVLAVLLLTGFTFQAFAAPTPERRARTMMVTGILSLAVLILGIGLMHTLHHGFDEGWIHAKLLAWLGLSAVSGIAFRKPEKVGLLTLLAIAFLALAVVAVYVLRTGA
ncbi:MAG: hypothetical protein H6828_09265 [Planctomycetes bacterium]|nr:hypothetical protein [Planctomycetota bacterium]